MTDALTLYNDYWAIEGELEVFCATSLAPRSAEMLYDYMATFGIAPGDRVLDIGSRDATYAIELARRFGCSVVAIDPAPIHRGRAAVKIAAAGLEGQVRAEVAAIEAIPIAEGTVDAIWCRDVLNHVDLAAGLRECARVLRPGGRMLVYQTFGSDLIEPLEAARLYAALAIAPENMREDTFQRVAAQAGLTITLRDVVASEWRERWVEEGRTQLLDDLMWVARMRRREGELVARYGRGRYEAVLGGCLWGIYQMLGKLQPTVYLLERGTGGANIGMV